MPEPTPTTNSVREPISTINPTPERTPTAGPVREPTPTTDPVPERTPTTNPMPERTPTTGPVRRPAPVPTTVSAHAHTTSPSTAPAPVAAPPPASAPPSTYFSRLAQFIRGSYPLVPSVVFAVAWTLGVTGLYAAVDPRTPSWRPGLGTALAALTLIVDLLLMRALDDIRDLDYDREFHKDRPLASGAVHIKDLVILYAAGTAALILLNLDAPTALLILLAQLTYTALLIVTAQRWHRPSPSNLIGNMLASLPVPLLLHAYLYARYLHGTGRGPDWRGTTAIAAVILAAGHLEMAKKLKRSPKPTERTYVNQLGLRATLTIALTAPLVSVALVLLLTRTPAAWTPAAIGPLALPALAYHRFQREHRPRWPAQSPPLYLLATFIGYFVLGLVA